MLEKISIEQISDENKEKYEAVFKDTKKMAVDKLTEQLNKAPESGTLKDEINSLIDEVKKEEFQEKVIKVWNSHDQEVGLSNIEELSDGLISRAKSNIGLI